MFSIEEDNVENNWFLSARLLIKNWSNFEAAEVQTEQQNDEERWRQQ